LDEENIKGVFVKVVKILTTEKENIAANFHAIKEQIVIDAINVGLATMHKAPEEALSTESFLSYFYPFDKLDFRKCGIESG